MAGRGEGSREEGVVAEVELVKEGLAGGETGRMLRRHAGHTQEGRLTEAVSARVVQARTRKEKEEKGEGGRRKRQGQKQQFTTFLSPLGLEMIKVCCLPAN